MGQILTQGGSNIDPNIKPLDQSEGSSSTSAAQPLDGGRLPSAESQSQRSDRAPLATVSPASSPPADGEAVALEWTGDGETARDNRQYLAENLGVSLGSIGAPFWSWMEGVERKMHSVYDDCRCRCDGERDCPHGDVDDCPCPCPVTGNADSCECVCSHNRQYRAELGVLTQVIRDSREKTNPVGYMRSVLESQLFAA